jgi:hypothetical protein
MDPSSFFFCQRAGGNTITTTADTKIYGGNFGMFSWTYDGVTIAYGNAYLGVSGGDIIGLTIDNRGGYFGNALVGDRMTVWGEIISTSFPTNYPTNMRISNPSAYVWGCYGAGGTISTVDYALPSVGVFQWNQNGGGPYQIYFKDCNPALPEQSGALPKAVSLTNGALTNNIGQVLYYDDSAGTFTDYTTQANNDTADDVPLSGDVGDIYYFRYTTSSAYQTPLAFTITNQTNDYVYVWETYLSGAWKTIDQTWDLTENFTKSGVIWNAYVPTIVLINGVNSYWLRCRIVTKGTATPTFSRVKSGNWTGVGTWRIYEQFSATLTIEDEAGDAIENATVTVTDTFGTETTLTSDVNGLTTKTFFTANTLQFDPVNGDSSYKVLKTPSNPYTITVEKAGYETVNLPITINKKLELTVPLKTQITKLEDDNGNVFDRVDKTNSGTTNLRRKLTKVM